MAKLGLVFVAVFCIIQVSLAARLPREAPPSSSTEPSFWDSAKGAIDKFSGRISDEFSKTFNKENADKILKTVSDGAKDFQDKAKEFAGDVQEKFSELGKDAEKKVDEKKL